MSRIKEFNLPDLGEGLTEGEILTWLVQVGETIELNQPIVEVETAKAAVEIPAKWAGVVTQIFHEARHDGRGRLADHLDRHPARRGPDPLGRVTRGRRGRAGGGRGRARPDRWSGSGRPHGRPGRLRPEDRRREAPTPHRYAHRPDNRSTGNPACGGYRGGGPGGTRGRCAGSGSGGRTGADRTGTRLSGGTRPARRARAGQAAGAQARPGPRRRPVDDRRHRPAGFGDA
nr:hypothetical protein GCM10020092_001120 [Actinoplanes digitatis]